MGTSPRDVATVDDLSLFAAWQAAVRQADEALFARHDDALARFFRTQVSEPTTADLIQNTWRAGVEGRQRIVGTGRFRGNRFGVLHNLLRCHDQGRRKQDDSLDREDEPLAALAGSAERLPTPLSNLEKWAADLRGRFAQSTIAQNPK